MAKKVFGITIKKSDGTLVQQGILAQDTPGATKKPTLPDPCPASLMAHIAALAAAGPNAEVVQMGFGNSVDIDTTV